MSRFCSLGLAAGVLMAAGAFVYGAETHGEGAGVSSATVQQPAAGPAAPAGGGILLPLTTGFVAGAGEQKDGATAVQASSETAAEVIPDSGPVIPMNHCHCVMPRTPTPMDPMPYYIGKLTEVSPLCKKTELKLNGKTIFEQLIFCKELERCWQGAAQFGVKRHASEKEISAARDKCILEAIQRRMRELDNRKNRGNK